MDDEEIPYDHEAEDSMPQNNSIQQQSENSEATMQEQNTSSLKWPLQTDSDSDVTLVSATKS